MTYRPILILALLGLLPAVSFGGDPIVRNVFIPASELDPAKIPERKAELDAERAALEELERRYIASYRALSRAAMKPDELIVGLKSQSLESLKKWFEEQKAHHALIDQLNMEKFNYFVKELRFYADQTYLELTSDEFPNVSAENQTRLMRAHAKLLEKHENFLQHLDKYGTPKDTFRLAAVRDSFAAAKEYFATLQKITETRGERLERLRKKVAAFPKKFWENVKILALAPDAIKLGKDILLNGGGRINNTVNRAFIKAAKLKGYAVTIKNRKNLALATTDREEKTVNIIAKVHRGPVLDNMVLANLELKDYAFVTSFGSVIPDFYSDRLQDNPGIAFVGPGFPNGIETVTDKAINNPERIMVNYAEGSIGNMGETRPIAVKFSTAVIPELRKKGYRVNLIPVTSQSASFMKKDIGKEFLFGKVIEANVHPPITDEMISFLEESGMLENLGVLIRSTWLSELQTDVDEGGNLIEGALSIRGIEKMTIKYMNVHYAEFEACSRFLKK